jgi:hypothetical protein
MPGFSLTGTDGGARDAQADIQIKPAHQGIAEWSLGMGGYTIEAGSLARYRYAARLP